MRLIIDTRVLNSNISVSNDKSEVVVNLSVPLEVVSVNVISCEIPYNFYQLLNETNDVNINGSEYSFPEGSYMIQQLCDMLQQFIDQKLNNVNWGVVNYNRNTQRVNILIDPLLTATLTIAFTNCFRMFGFSNATPIVLSNTGVKNVIAPFPPNLKTVNSLFIQSNIVNENCILNGRLSNVLLRIPLNSTPTNVLTYNGSSDFPTYVNGTIQHIRLKIVDEYGSAIQVNGDWLIELYLNR